MTVYRDGTLVYTQGTDLPDTAVWWRDMADNLIDFSLGYTFTAKVQNEAAEDQFTPKTTNINGAVGAGEYPDGTPNLVVTWSQTGEIDSLAPGRYTLILVANKTATGKDRIARIPLVVERTTDFDWTYSGDPDSTSRDRIRFLVGDTDSSDPLLYDAEIASIIAADGYGYDGASKAALAIAAKFGRKMARSIGSLSASFDQQYQHYLELASTLQKKASAEPVMPFASGWVGSEKVAIEDDTDREELFGQKGGMDNRTDGNVTVGWRSLW